MNIPNTMTNLTRRGKLLVADDDELFRDGLVQWLERQHYECTCVADAAAALACLRASEYDAMISDIKMPGNAGLKLIEQTPQVATGLPVFLLTGQPSLETATRSVRLAVAAYLVKPPNLVELDQMLQEAIVRYRRARQINESRAGLRSWDSQLEALMLSLQQSPDADGEKTLADYLQLTLRNVTRQLADLECTTATWRRQAEASTGLQKLDLVGALRRTVAVLRQTRQNFKSQELADLRRQLEALLGAS